MSSRADVPDFFLYGQPARPVETGFIHVETVMARRSTHHGRVAPHSHNQLSQVTFWTSGGGVYAMDEKELDFSAPAASFVPSRVVHSFTVRPGSDAIVVSLADGVLPGLAALAEAPVHEPIFVQAKREWPVMQSVMRLMLETYRSGQGGERVLKALAAAALAELLRSRHSVAPADPHAALAARFRLLVEQEFHRPILIAHCAARLNATPYLLHKACRKAFGCSPKALLDERRMTEAKRLLLFTVRSVEDIAFESGFTDPAYFSRAVRGAAGMSPRYWRASKR